MNEEKFLDFITNNPRGTKFPETPIIRGDLYLDGANIKWLPDNLVVISNLHIEGCPNLRILPANLFVGGNFKIFHTCRMAIPADLNVRGDVNAEGMFLDIHENFTFNGNLNLEGFIDSPHGTEQSLCLPDNLTVNGDLNVTNRVIKRWPKNLIVRGRLLANEIKGIIIRDLNF